MTMREGLEIAIRCHLCIRVTGSQKLRFEMLQDAWVNAGRVLVHRWVLDQRRDKVNLFGHILVGDCKLQMRMAVMRGLAK